MNVEDCVISKICNGNSIMVNTVMLEIIKLTAEIFDYYVIWLLFVMAIQLWLTR